eukprot:1815344-Prymnesium_polylepis.1
MAARLPEVVVRQDEVVVASVPHDEVAHQVGGVVLQLLDPRQDQAQVAVERAVVNVRHAADHARPLVVRIHLA